MNKDTVMRMYRSSLWLTVAIAIWCCTPMLGIAVAQYPGPDAGIFEQPAGQAATVPGGTAPGTAYTGPMDAGMMMTSPPGVFQPGADSLYYPQNSPYQHNFDQTYNLKGMWFNDSNNLPRRYEFGIEYLNATLFAPGTDMVGDAETYPIVPSHVVDPASGLPVEPDPFVAYNVSNLAPDSSNGMRGFGANGIKARFNIINPDDRQLMMDVFTIVRADSTWRPYDAADLTSFPSIQSTLRARGSIPLDNGIDAGATGATAEFDLDYKMGYKSGAWGSNIDWSPNAFIDKGPLKVRTVYGLTLTKIAEEFTFSGLQSNYGYFIDPFSGDVIDSSVVDSGFPFTETTLFSRTNSLVTGPEIGIRYDLGGDRLKFWGMTKAGVGVNYETIELGGNNVWDTRDHLTPTPTVTNPDPLAFNSKERHTHVSPIFQQQLFAEAPIFQYMPYVRKMYLFRNANFRMGYNFLLIGEVARPTKSIDWTEGNPTIDLHRSRWAMGATSFAIDWKY
ncbi:MAG: hypothetical protein KDA68_08080 [Planctomycetaceae bacterium]|nr:hypothetical protein [Planctomycetaceae bacterium]